jgi:transcriptional regulator with XRE-family HTH domain
MVQLVAKSETSFGRRLRELREAKGFTQESLGAACVPPMAYQQLAGLERGERAPNWTTVLRLAKALECRPDDFLSEGDL